MENFKGFKQLIFVLDCLTFLNYFGNFVKEIKH